MSRFKSCWINVISAPYKILTAAMIASHMEASRATSGMIERLMRRMP